MRDRDVINTSPPQKKLSEFITIIFKMNEKAIKEIKAINEEKNARETRVSSVDIRSSAGQGQEQRNVQVVHQSHPSANSKTSGGVLTGAAAAVASTLQSAKEAISKN